MLDDIPTNKVANHNLKKSRCPGFKAQPDEPSASPGHFAWPSQPWTIIQMRRAIRMLGVAGVCTGLGGVTLALSTNRTRFEG